MRVALVVLEGLQRDELLLLGIVLVDRGIQGGKWVVVGRSQRVGGR